MNIELDQVSKRYQLDWIFKNIDLTFREGQSYAVTGPNGSGKSTLMKIVSGFLSPSRGKVRFVHQNKPLNKDEVYRYLSFSAPYIDLIEEYTLKELIRFYKGLQPLANGLQTADVLKLLQLPGATNKPIKYFSSGMKQRVKLALSICSDTPALLLDEPTTNLDEQGAEWYRQLVGQFKKNRLLIVASNVAADFDFCEEHIHIPVYKTNS
jgi:ABC-type multidrug transport system ATPase subunit